jgi:pathogenesis-related protein 1
MKLLVRCIAIVSLLSCGLCLLNAQRVRSSPSAASSAVLDSASIQELLRAHNEVRRQRGIAPLRWSPRLAVTAQEWAEHLARIGELVHDRSRMVGQNLFASYGAARRPSFVVGKWAEESKDYDERHFRCARGAVCGHFTQLIWRETKEVGCGVAHGGNGEFWVCYYTPPGNFIGEKPY